jgi:predicted metal-dependent hydrolase
MMTISEDEIRKDFQRFIRQEAMRANCYQEDIMRILNLPLELQIVK